MPENLPSKPGFYWARIKGYNWFNLIAQVYGDVPFLRLDIWYVGTSEAVEDVELELIEEFGDLIAEEAPDVVGPRKDILIDAELHIRVT